MAEKSIIIIGGGIAGLAAGCYARMNNYKTTIYEAHDKPGGVCTAWQVGDYTFDGCIHWLLGSKPGSFHNNIWQELGALQNTQIVNHEQLIRVEDINGRSITLYTDINKLESHLLEVAPKDKVIIAELLGATRRLLTFELPADKPRELYSILDGIKVLFKMLPYLKTIKKYSNITIREFSQRCADPLLRDVFIWGFGLTQFPMLIAIMLLTWLHNKNSGYPVGGSLAFARTVEQRYKNLGGEIQYKSPIAKILVKNGAAIGVRTSEGVEHFADYIVSAADGHNTLFDMLDQQFVSEDFKQYYQKLPLFPPYIKISLGVARDFSSEPQVVSFPLAETIVMAGRSYERINVEHYCFDPTMAPPGKSAISIVMVSNWEYWNDLHKQPDKYQEQKQKIAQLIIDQLEVRYPGIKSDIEVIDVATPITYQRFTNNWKGTPEGWLVTPETLALKIRNPISKTLPGLDNFYMTGQWVEPGGGLPAVAQCSRNVIQIICAKDAKEFTTTIQQ